MKAPVNTNISSTISIDLLILLLTVPSAIQQQDAYLVVVILLLYMLISLWFPLAQKADDAQRKHNIGFSIRYALLLIMVTSTTVLPTMINILERATTPIEPDGYSPTYIELSDSAMQTELALNYIANSKNPYVERYENTPLRFYQ